MCTKEETIIEIHCKANTQYLVGRFRIFENWPEVEIQIQEILQLRNWQNMGIHIYH